jgi:hypothetical protein
MLIIVVAMFGICWFPLHLFILLLDFRPELFKTVSMETLTTLFIIFHWLAMSNSFANPIIYGFTNESFRVRFFYYFCYKRYNLHLIWRTTFVDIYHILFLTLTCYPLFSSNIHVHLSVFRALVGN